MSLKRNIAAILFAATVVVAVAPQAQAAETSTTDDAVQAQAEQESVAVFSMSDVVSGTTEDEAYVSISENPAPLSSTYVTDQSKDQSESEALAKKEAKEVKAKQTAAEKKAKKEYENNLKLLATIIYCEAGGQCYAGRLAVGAVVMNRVNSSYYPNTVKGVIWQPYQFGPVRQGKMAREMAYYDKGMYNYPERSGSLKAAKDILAGKYTVVYNGQTIDLKKYTNFNGHLSNAKIRISGHDFA